MLLHCKGQLLSSLIFTLATAVVISEARTAGKKSPGSKVADATQSTQPTGGQGSQANVRRPHQDAIYGEDNCKSEKLRELILETIGLFPHQYSYQARYMKQQAEDRFGNWWSAVIISEKGGYGMSAVYDQYTNTTCELRIFDTFYWLGRTS
uniref:Uncharacterized protein n=1 Tax=Parascaris univalens TaxID=6257 RepID=A0A915CAB8_PARUN